MAQHSSPLLYPYAEASQSFDETKGEPAGYADESYYYASAAYDQAAAWQQQDEEAEAEAIAAAAAAGGLAPLGLGSYRSPSFGSEGFDGEDELDMPSTLGIFCRLFHPPRARAFADLVRTPTDVAEALEFEDNEGEEEEEEEGMREDFDGAPSSTYTESGYAQGFYPPYATNMVWLTPAFLSRLGAFLTHFFGVAGRNRVGVLESVFVLWLLVCFRRRLF
jgi:hypothetical protein